MGQEKLLKQKHDTKKKIRKNEHASVTRGQQGEDKEWGEKSLYAESPKPCRRNMKKTTLGTSWTT